MFDISEEEREAREKERLVPRNRMLASVVGFDSAEMYEAIRLCAMHTSRELGKWMEYEKSVASIMLETYEEEYFPSVLRARKIAFQVGDWRKKELALMTKIQHADERGDIALGDQLYEEVKKAQDEQVGRCFRIMAIDMGIRSRIDPIYPKPKRGGSVKRSASLREADDYEPKHLAEPRD